MSKAVAPVSEQTSWVPGLMYNVVLTLLLPFIILGLAWRILVQGKSRDGLRQRLGVLPPELAQWHDSGEPVVWIHAVSVGEVSAVEPILRELRRLNPLLHVVLSTTTSTGRQVAEKRGLEADALVYFPFDFIPLAVWRALATVQPDLVMLVETELWPNFLWLARQRGARTMLVNGRISDRHFPRMKWVRPLYRWTLSNVELLYMQSRVDAERVRELGGPPERVVAVGNSKFDADYPQVAEAQQAQLRAQFGLGQETAVVVAGSTAPGEEQLILEAFGKVRAQRADVRMILAPRHPERADEVAQLIRDHGYEVLRRTEVLAAEKSDQPLREHLEDRIVLLDTIGELAAVYSIATIVVLGRSFQPLGGSNVLEPMAQGKPTIFGPHMENFRDIAELARRARVAFQVADGDELHRELQRLLSRPEELEWIAEAARAVIAENQGASRQCAEASMAALEQEAGPR